MKYKFGAAIILTTSVLFSQSVGYINAEVHQSEQTENTSKSISFEQAQKMNPKELTDLLTDEDLKLHNKDAEENSTEIESNQHTNEAYQDVNNYIAKNNIKPSTITQDSRMDSLPKYDYKSDKFIGVIIHETANPDSTIDEEINYMYNNYESAFVHAYASSSKIVQTASSDYLAWGAGAKANPYFYQIELAQSSTFDQFAKSVNNQAYLTAKMLHQNGLKPSLADNNEGTGTVISHNAISQYYGGTDHTDPINYFSQWGYDMDQFYSLVQKHYNDLNESSDSITGDTHTVVSGDTLYNISQRSGVSVAKLKSLNNLSSNDISVGQVLKLK
ncbi:MULTISPECIES: LysM peptidoglycan-binding domain-containing protein [Mammaliicoccus]|uniref:LysM peptidoglycan-binding domain-containing protein n=1 Tax=Mammaliicoccus TaxID=2803850 RepID=UPI000D1F3D01|nr:MULTISPECIES: LysM peptidoglycan-binding domain-containing protein [Mammaliicoccus]MEB5758678.1 LysM peptidoglycan-binding domain-containing protein [Mammaliicoccus sciuri]PTK07232.1 amidase [Mammaliicoccus sciuri]HDK8090707.1 LysM peptidoglycan-binding domain-containing protein [Staphylococcus aureus]